MLKEIIYEQKLLDDIFKILTEGSSKEAHMCCKLLLILKANENIKKYLIKNKHKMMSDKKSCVKPLKHLMSFL